ncbi:hypothetical protein PS947_04118 [Pseudomonas fluorescens]|nr:hypothetical protein PS947_04118 [Pseudomonas fluorescens]
MLFQTIIVGRVRWIKWTLKNGFLSFKSLLKPTLICKVIFSSFLKFNRLL